MIETLRRLPGFDRLSDAALQLVVTRSAIRRYEPGQTVLAAGSVAETLLARIEGDLVDAAGVATLPVFDAPGLLFGLAAREDYRAGPDGLSALVVAKPHVFTIVREFPEFVVSLFRHGEAA
jgi:hypothetical protein